MSTAVQLRRGTTAEHSSFTGAVGEVTVDTTKDVIVVHDGITIGGVPMARGDHLHTGVYEPADATILKEADLGVSIVEQSGATASAAIPTGTEAQRDGSPQAGYLRFNTDANGFEGYDGSAWGPIGGGAVDGMFYENAQVVTKDYTIGATVNAMSAGPRVSIATGITVTIETGGAWTIV